MAAWAPAVEGWDAEGGKFTVRCHVPGVDRPDVDVSGGGRILTISGMRKDAAPSDDPWVRDVTHGKFTRTFTLPEGIDASSMKVTPSDGVLEVEFRFQKRR
jgi:HSP20 family protein